MDRGSDGNRWIERERGKMKETNREEVRETERAREMR